MDFLEEIQKHEESMNNAYLIITRKLTLEDIYDRIPMDDDVDKFYLPFDPTISDGRDAATIDLVVEFLSSMEEYEKCAKLIKIKECLEERTD